MNAVPPVPDAVVRVYARIRSGTRPLDIEIGQTTTGTDGGFSLLLPSNLTP
jgi:hypothetical protein